MKFLAKSFIYGNSIHHNFFFEISSCRKPFLDPPIYFIQVKFFGQNDKFSNKNDMFAACRDFKKHCGDYYKHK